MPSAVRSRSAVSGDSSADPSWFRVEISLAPSVTDHSPSSSRTRASAWSSRLPSPPWYSRRVITVSMAKKVRSRGWAGAQPYGRSRSGAKRKANTRFT